MLIKLVEFLCLYVLLLAICVGCDLVTNALPEKTWKKGLTDNLSHGLIAFMSWCIVLFPERINHDNIFTIVMQSLICLVVACAIDIDHFVQAKSFHITNAVTLSRRPFLHCTTVPIVILVVFLFFGWLKSCRKLVLLAWLIFVAFISHHLRDSTRRGLWLLHFKSSHPLPYNVYLIAQLILPVLVKICLKLSLPTEIYYPKTDFIA